MFYSRIVMLKRAEGCGKWLSTKEKLPRGDPKKDKRKDKLQRSWKPLVAKGRNKCGGNILVSTSPLSPRTKKRLENAKQSKLSRFYESSSRVKSFKFDAKVMNSTTSTNQSLDDLKHSIQITRLQEYSKHIQGEFQEEKSHELNVSGVSSLSDLSQENDQDTGISLDEASLPFDNGNSPPNKKLRTSETTPVLSESECETPLAMVEDVESQTFCFTQWARKQVLRCKQIQEDPSLEDCLVDLHSLPRCHDDFDLCFDQEETGVEFSETPPFEFTQWMKQQVQICQKIQAASDSQCSVDYQWPENELCSSQVVEQGLETLKCSGKSCQFRNDTESEFCFSEWVKSQEAVCKNLQEETNNIESDKWDKWQDSNRKESV